MTARDGMDLSADSAVRSVPPGGVAVVDENARAVRSWTRQVRAAFDRDAVVRPVEVAEHVDVGTPAVTEEVDRVVEDGVGPGKLRVCLGRFDPYLERRTHDLVVDGIGVDRVRGHSGMYHALIAIGGPETLEMAFEVPVEVRTTCTGQLQHRWRLDTVGIGTG